MASVVNAKDIVITVDDIVVGCAQSADFTVEADMDAATCAASGGWDQVSSGRKRWSGSISALYRKFETGEQAANISYEDVFDLITEGTKVSITYGTNVTGDTRFGGDAYISNLGFSQPESGNVTWSADLTGTGPLGKTTVSTPIVLPTVA
ncbi:phage tail tube protein [Hymenobacter sp. BT491]|uniref:phage tail tube protein n=1 Tax=Hymenobacter sp. BT491 TaxID=2766779 RepID=UPI0016539217|nr:phage tail tube protein [Hymenobacter sp. BT491]MBC6988934.1 hypothetical protein [Hymenobacter sp. BT491]